MKVYAIVISSGDYEDRRKWIDSIWNDSVLAEKARESITEEYLEMRETEIPNDDNFYLWAEAIRTREAGMNFNYCEIVEFELNKRDK